MMRVLAAVALLPMLFGAAASAHELRPAYLEMTETSPEHYDVLWKVPARGEVRLSLDVRLPDTCRNTVPPIPTRAEGAEITRWSVQCAGALTGRTIAIEGLVSTFTDVLVRIVHADGTVQTARLMPDYPVLEVTASPSAADTAGTYFLLGVQHILEGLDHLLFVLVLLLLVRNPRTLVATITAFTVAHSITLAFAALGLAAVPQPPVEALIALSIALVSSEVIRKDRGQSDLAGRFPWAIAFLFGLLHGFGFGGALRDIGLPQKDVPLALLTFNLGVEAGQLLFVGVILLAAAALNLLLALRLDRARFWISYVVGCLSAVWFVQRVAAFGGF